MTSSALAQKVTSNVPYVPAGHDRQVLDIHSPANAKDLPVVFWIHGGGWVTGDKTSVQNKPAAFTEKGFVFVTTNYRLLPEVAMEEIVSDVAQALAWVNQNIAQHGGDPGRIFVMGHSAGAQLAALLCTDDRHLKAVGVPFSILKGCVPVDGDTFDIPAIIETAETRRRAHQQPQAKFGHCTPAIPVRSVRRARVGKKGNSFQFIALQIHGNSTAIVRYKDIAITELTAAKAK